MTNCNTKGRLSATEFELIAKWLKQGYSIRKIARLLERSPSTISRQVNNPYNRQATTRYRKPIVVFSDKLAIANQTLNKKGRGRHSKLWQYQELAKRIESDIKTNKWSPEISLGKAMRDNIPGANDITVKTVYNSIYREELDVSLLDLHLKLRRSPNRERHIRQHKRRLGKSIEERPDISNRQECGHYEADCILWGHNFAVLSIIERTTRQAKLIKLDRHDSQSVNHALSNIQLDIPIKTLTLDNGSEFTNVSQLITETYYTHPYSSFEKGSVENLNNLIRRYIPRSTATSRITQQLLDDVANKINNLPRPIHNFLSSNEMVSIILAS